MSTDGIGQRFQQGCGLADPVSKGGTVEVEPFAAEDLALTIERQVIGIFADQNVRQKARPRAATLDRTRRQWSLHKPFAAGAGQPGPDDAVYA